MIKKALKEDFCPLCKTKVDFAGKTGHIQCLGCNNTLLVPSDYSNNTIAAVYHGYGEEEKPLSWLEYLKMQTITLSMALERKGIFSPAVH